MSNGISSLTPPKPTGIVISFIAGFVGIGISAVLFYFKPELVAIIGTTALPSWYIFLVVALIIRHQLRVVFIDSTAAIEIKNGFLKAAVSLLIPLAVMGSIALSVTDIHLLIGAIYMFIYSALFTIFWGIILFGINASTVGEYQKKLVKILLPIITDVVLVVFWWYSMSASGSNSEGMPLLGVVACCGMALEVYQVYGSPFVERIRTVGVYFNT